MSREKSSVGGGATRYTERQYDGSTKDVTVSREGRVESITHHTNDGKSHEHTVGHNADGSYSDHSNKK